MRRYFLRKLFIYGLTFFVAVTVDWAIPHLMPGNPVVHSYRILRSKMCRSPNPSKPPYARAFRTRSPAL